MEFNLKGARRCLLDNILLCVVLTCLVLSPVATQATNPQFTAIYVFGDSYCDIGNIYAATGGAEPASLLTTVVASRTAPSGSNTWQTPGATHETLPLRWKRLRLRRGKVTVDYPLAAKHSSLASPTR